MQNNWKIVGTSRKTTGHGESCREVKIRKEGWPIEITITEATRYLTDEVVDGYANNVASLLNLADEVLTQTEKQNDN